MVSRDGPIAAINRRASLGALSPSPDERGGDHGRRRACARAAGPGRGRGAARPGQVKVIADTAPAVQIFAVRPSWVRVRAADGTVLFEKILDAGERYTVPQTEEPADPARGQFGIGLFRGQRQDLRPGGARRAGGQERRADDRQS